jgi:hypothetical protein
MHRFHSWYLQMSKEEDPMHMFGVKFRNHDFFNGEDDLWVNFDYVHAIYHQDALNISIITI